MLLSRSPVKWLNILAVILLAIVYIAYLFFIISVPFGPVDFETFRDIGRRFVTGGNPFGENSYYPMPYVSLFGILSLLPRPLAVVIWLGSPVVLATVLVGPWALAFAPLFGHFIGGQSSIFGMVAIWAQKNQPDNWSTGILLAAATMKPHLAVVPVLWAFWSWFNAYRVSKRVPAPALTFLASCGLLWLPWFALRPDWVGEWLAHPRALSGRAIAALFPRMLLGLSSPWYYLVLALIAAGIIYALRHQFKLDIAVLLWFICSPFVHDYDLIQLLPLMDTPRKRLAGLLAAAPLWVVIACWYAQDGPWAVATIIAPTLLAYFLRDLGRGSAQNPTQVSAPNLSTPIDRT